MYNTGQLLVRIVGHIDMLLFFTAFFGSIFTEIYVCETQPVSIPSVISGFTGGHQEGLVVQDSSSTDVLQGTATPTTTERPWTIWDVRKTVMEKSLEYGGPWLYHPTYILFWASVVAYYVYELWQYCVLLRGVNTRQPRFFNEWLTWKVIILLGLIGLSTFNLSGGQATCTDLFVVPLVLYRILMIGAVTYYLFHIKRLFPQKEMLMKNRNRRNGEK